MDDEKLFSDDDFGVTFDTLEDSNENIADNTDSSDLDLEIDADSGIDLNTDFDVEDALIDDDILIDDDELLDEDDIRLDDDEDLLGSDSLEDNLDVSEDGTEIDMAEMGLIASDDSEEENTEDEYVIAKPSSSYIDADGNLSVMDNSFDDNQGFELVYVKLDRISVAAARIRKSQSVEDLYKSIKSTGLLEPLILAPTQTEGYYILIHGYRRLLACAKAGIKNIPCNINNRVKTTEIPILEALYNHHKKYSMKEIIAYTEYLEKEQGICSASMIEEIIQMDNGDYSKLKDILEDDDPDITTKLYEEQMTIQQAFKALENRRKKESREEKDLKRAAKAYDESKEGNLGEQVKESGETGDANVALSDDELKELAINPAKIDEDLEDESIEDMIAEGENINGYEAHQQDYKNRERLDPDLRKAALARDENTCKICGLGGPEYVDVLDEHHINEVYLGGKDELDNLITACTVCHKLVHKWGRGELHMRPLEDMKEAEMKKFKKIIFLGNKIRKGMELKGMKVAELKKVDKAETIGRTKPGTGQEAG